MKRKILSLCLSLLLALSLLPTAAFAVEELELKENNGTINYASTSLVTDIKFTPSKSGVYVFEVKESHDNDLTGNGGNLRIAKESDPDNYLNALVTYDNAGIPWNARCRLAVPLTAGTAYIIQHIPVGSEGPYFTLTEKMAEDTLLTKGVNKSFTATEWEYDVDTNYFKFHPSDSGWYTISSNVFAWLWIFDDDGNSCVYRNANPNIDSVGTNIYLDTMKSYYFCVGVIDNANAGGGTATIMIDDAVIPKLTVNNDINISTGQMFSTQCVSFTPTISGSYTFYATADRECLHYIYILDDKRNAMQDDDNEYYAPEPTMTRTLDLEKGKTYYICALSAVGGLSCKMSVELNNGPSIATTEISLPEGSLTYTGNPIAPDPIVKLNGNTLTKNTDYTVSYSNNVNVGTATVTIRGSGNYSGTKTLNYNIEPASIGTATVTAAAGSHIYYSGSAITPVPTVELSGKTLVSGTDYTVAYSDNVNAGTATVTVTGKGNYTGTASTTFTINKAQVLTSIDTYLKKEPSSTATIDLNNLPGIPRNVPITYTVDAVQTPPTGFTAAVNNGILTLTSTGNGTSSETCTVTGTSANYDITDTIRVTYTDKDIKTIAAPEVTSSVTYNGAPAVVYTGEPSVDGEENAEFSISYKGINGTVYDSTTAPANTGSYTVTFALEGEADFVANPVVKEFTITPATPAFTAPTITRITAAAPLSSVTLTGGEVKGVDKAVIPGTFSWSGDTSANVVQGTEYTWTFTPETPNDNYDFSAVTGKLTPWTSGGGGNNGGNSGGSSSGSSGGTTTKPPVTEPETPTDPVTPPPTTTFPDVPADAYYADAVAWAVSKGITTGTGDGNFSPAAPCTRAQVVTFLWRAAGSPAPTSTASFADVPADAYYRDAVLWAVETGITNGTGADAFSPNATVDRAQTVTFLYRYAGSPAASGGGFDDVDSGSYYADAVAWAVSQEITNGTSPTTFAPASNCTRGQTVTFLFRALAQ